MSNIGKAIRHKRFQIQPKRDVTLFIETSIGRKISLKILDCSRNGICAAMMDSESENYPELQPSDIIPNGKIMVDDFEYALGRLVLRTIRTVDGANLLGFSTVDLAVPITGSFSKYLSDPLNESNTPYNFELSSKKFTIANFSSDNQSNVDLFAKCRQFSIYLEEWEKTNKYAYHNIRTASKGTRISLQRKRSNGRNDYIIMGSNDYLGLAAHPEVIEAARRALDKYGFGSTGSSVTTGITDLHEKLSQRIAQLYGKEKALLFNSGYTANVGIINGLTGVQDFISCDFKAHASIHDAIQMSRATNRCFKHNDINHLDRILKENRDKHEGALVVTEGIFSMDGDIPPLDEIYRVARKHNARLMVDEAHSLGVIGPRGLGAADKFNLIDEVDVIMGTFSKICGGIGGFAVGTKQVVDWLHHFSRPYLFSISLPPSTVAAADKALEIFESDKSALKRLKDNIRHFAMGLKNIGFNINENHESSIIPVVIGDEAKLGIMYEKLLQAGIFVVPIIYPAVSRNNCRFRFTICSEHSIADLDLALMALIDAMKLANFSPLHTTNKENINDES